MKRSAPLRRSPFPRQRKEAPRVEREPHPVAKATRRPAGAKKAEQAHKTALAGMGCMACKRLFPQLAPAPVELHHLRTGGWGKGDYTTLIPLCVEHHRGNTGVHGLGTKGFAKHYGFDQADLLADVRTILEGQHGKSGGH